MIDPASVFLLLKGAVTLVWLAVFFIFAPGAIRFFRGRGSSYDPLRALMSYLIVKDLWFQSRGWLFGHHVIDMTTGELWWYIGALLASLGGAHLMLQTVHGYERADAAERR